MFFDQAEKACTNNVPKLDFIQPMFLFVLFLSFFRLFAFFSFLFLSKCLCLTAVARFMCCYCGSSNAKWLARLLEQLHTLRLGVFHKIVSIFFFFSHTVNFQCATMKMAQLMGIVQANIELNCIQYWANSLLLERAEMMSEEVTLAEIPRADHRAELS